MSRVTHVSCLAAFLLLASSVLAAGAPLSPRAAAAVAPVHQAYEKARAEQAGLPPPGNVAEVLLRLEALDQAGRRVPIDLGGLDKTEAEAAIAAINREMMAQDLENQKKLKALLPPEGWFRISIYGSEAATAAFLVVQHAVNDPALMRAALARMETLRRLGEVSGEDYALLYDRVALEFDHRPQRYGSQVGCVKGRMAPLSVEDPARIDQRRKTVGMRETLAQYLKHFPARC